MKTVINNKEYGSWAVITGASSGIGKEFAKTLAASNFNVVLIARRLKLLEELGQELHSKHGVQYKAIEADLSQEQSVEKIIQATRELDVGLVVSNAGTGAPGEFIDKGIDDLLHMVNTSVISHLKIAHHYGRKFAQCKRGGLILVSAMGAKNGLPFMANDAGTRAYIRSLGLGLHVELKRYNVNVTVLEASPTDTPIVPELGFDSAKMPMSILTTAQCVNETLMAFTKKRPIIIPGRKFRLMNKLVPDSFIRKMNGKMLAEGNGISWVK